MGAERLWFYLRLYPYCVVRSIQAKMSYKSDFILGVTASILMQSLGFVFVWAIFQGIPEMNGWNFYQMVFVYGMKWALQGKWRTESYSWTAATLWSRARRRKFLATRRTKGHRTF